MSNKKGISDEGIESEISENELIKSAVAEVWKKEKYVEVGNVERIVGLVIKSIKDNLQSRPNSGIKVDYEVYQQEIIKELAEILLSKYPEGIPSFIRESRFKEDSSVATIFVFKLNKEIRRRYEKIQKEYNKTKPQVFQDLEPSSSSSEEEMEEVKKPEKPGKKLIIKHKIKKNKFEQPEIKNKLALKNNKPQSTEKNIQANNPNSLNDNIENNLVAKEKDGEIKIEGNEATNPQKLKLKDNEEKPDNDSQETKNKLQKKKGDKKISKPKKQKAKKVVKKKMQKKSAKKGNDDEAGEEEEEEEGEEEEGEEEEDEGEEGDDEEENTKKKKEKDTKAAEESKEQKVDDDGTPLTPDGLPDFKAILMQKLSPQYIEELFTFENIWGIIKAIFKIADQRKTLTEKEKTIINIKFLTQSFSEMDKEAIQVVKIAIAKYAEKNSKKYKKEFPDEYDMYADEILNSVKKPKSFEDKLFYLYKYFVIDLADVLEIIFKSVRFFCGLNTQMEIMKNEIYIKVFCKDSKIESLAEFHEYELQTKPYSKLYSLFKMIRNEKKRYLIKEEAQAISRVFCEKTLQFHQLDRDNQHDWPPHHPFYKEKSGKYRKYMENDDFHDCPLDGEHKYDNKWDFSSESDSSDDDKNKKLKNKHSITNSNISEIAPINSDKDSAKVGLNIKENKEEEEKCECRIFRNIDKLRIIQNSLEDIININLIKKFPNYVDYFYQRNYKAYKDKLNLEYLVLTKKNLWSTETQTELVQFFRNFMGEKIAYYFLFITHLSKGLILQSLIGIGIYVLKLIQYGPIEELRTNLLLFQLIHPNDIIIMGNCIIIMFWSCFFIKVWFDRENFNTYVWGMDNIESNTPYRKEFDYDTKNDFIFNKRIPYEPYWKHLLRIITSYTILLVITSFSIATTYGLLQFDNFTPHKQGADNSYFASPWKILAAFIQGIQIEFTSWFFKEGIIYLNDFENHEKHFQYENALVIKRILYEVINNYNSLLYIGIVKDNVTYCKENNCLKEVEVQVYAILGAKFVAKWLELMKILRQKKKDVGRFYGKDGKEVPPHSLVHQRSATVFDSLLLDYNEVLILFGYIVFFSSAASLTPFGVFLILVMKKIIDSYKIAICSKVNMIDGSTGIEVYKSVFVFFCFGGLLANAAIALYANTGLSTSINSYTGLGKNYSLEDKYWFQFIKFAILVAVFTIGIIYYFIFSTKFLPEWFTNINMIKNQYSRKFYEKDNNNLPHHLMVEKEIVPGQEEVVDDDLFADNGFEDMIDFEDIGNLAMDAINVIGDIGSMFGFAFGNDNNDESNSGSGNEGDSGSDNESNSGSDDDSSSNPKDGGNADGDDESESDSGPDSSGNGDQGGGFGNIFGGLSDAVVGIANAVENAANAGQQDANASNN